MTKAASVVQLALPHSATLGHQVTLVVAAFPLSVSWVVVVGTIEKASNYFNTHGLNSFVFLLQLIKVQDHFLS